MVKGYQRSHSMARKKKVTPGGINTIIYRRRAPQAAHCALCGAILGGVPAKRPIEMSKMPKTYKRPERIYGGRVCPKCLKNEIIKVVNEVNIKTE
jgi:large subunit ribosomal protein L34e